VEETVQSKVPGQSFSSGVHVVEGILSVSTDSTQRWEEVKSKREREEEKVSGLDFLRNISQSQNQKRGQSSEKTNNNGGEKNEEGLRGKFQGVPGVVASSTNRGGDGRGEYRSRSEVRAKNTLLLTKKTMSPPAQLT